MMSSLGIILVHGYSGSDQDLQPLAQQLAALFGQDSVTNLALPGHNPSTVPAFDEDRFIETIHQSIECYRKKQRKIILIGHSTGGTLLLATLQRFAIQPNLLILIAVPQKIDQNYLHRWEAHRAGKTNLPLIDVALMVKLINTTGSKRLATTFPVLIIQGEADRLVLSSEAQALNRTVFSQSARVITIPQADHGVFQSENSPVVTDLIQRAIHDLTRSQAENVASLNALIAVEPGLQGFFQAEPASAHHLISCPGAQRAHAKKPALLPLVNHDPVIANIEITTYCNLKCKFCARAQLRKGNRHMPPEVFRNILTLLPNVYKIVLVGLGEPLMHPQIGDLIKYAKSLGKKIGLVTNAMLLNPEITRQLLAAGLDSIAFSIDGADARLASLVRPGTDFNQVVAAIKQFVQFAKASRKISTAVFAAVSSDTVGHLKELVNQVAELGVDVLMLSDLNFSANLAHTLWQNQDARLETLVKQAVSQGFSKGLPVLSVRGLEEFGLEQRYQDFLMIPPSQLYTRSNRHTWCLSPWQTIPVDVSGNITLCDCQPDRVIGNLCSDSLTEIWNGEAIQNFRAAMLSPQPPEACRICPRF